MHVRIWSLCYEKKIVIASLKCIGFNYNLACSLNGEQKNIHRMADVGVKQLSFASSLFVIIDRGIDSVFNESSHCVLCVCVCVNWDWLRHCRVCSWMVISVCGCEQMCLTPPASRVPLCRCGELLNLLVCSASVHG